MSSTQPYNDKELLLQIANGDSQAFRHLFDKYYAPLCFFINTMTNNLSEAEDIVQEVFYKIWNRKQELAAISHAKSYLYTSVRNAWLDALKKKRLTKVSETELSHAAQQSEWEPAFVLEEVLQMVINEMESLPDKYKQVLQMLYFDGLSYREVSEKLNIPEATLRKQKERAIELLRTELLKKHMASKVVIALSLFFY